MGERMCRRRRRRRRWKKFEKKCCWKEISMTVEVMSTRLVTDRGMEHI
jgi:hypothetical protein